MGFLCCQYHNLTKISCLLRIHEKSPDSRYVDGTPTPAKIQISHLLKVGQFYIDVYSISNFEWQNFVQIL